MSPFYITILTLFPDYFSSPLKISLLGKAQEKDLVKIDIVDIRDYCTDKHRQADDVPYGGGAGMVMKPEPLVAAIEAAKERHVRPVVYMTPQGSVFKQQDAHRLAQEDGIIFVCGHYEGIDERVREGWIDIELSIGDYVLTGGEPAVCVVADATVRLLDGVVGNPESLVDESHQGHGLEYPQYTRPRSFRGMDVPEVLLNGHHAKIEEWRLQKSRERTATRRPDLLDKIPPETASEQ